VPEAPPNVLLIHVDELRADIAFHTAGESYAGSLPNVAWPNLDRLRREGVTIRNAFCNFPICVPSRASFITGKYPRQLRVYNNHGNLPADEPTLGHRLSEVGYETVALGRTHRQHRGFHKWPEVDGASAFGYGSHSSRCPSHEVVGVYDGDPEEQHDLRTARQFAEFLGGRDASRPCAAMVGFMAPHPPWYPPRAFAGRYRPDDIVLPTQPEGVWRQKPRMQRIPAEKGWLCHEPEVRRRMAAAYLDLCTYADSCLGEVLTALDRVDALDRTVIAFFADHGEQLGEHDMLGKFHNFYEGSLRTPLVWRLPGGAHAGLELASMVELVDLVPTLLDFAGVGEGEDLPGRSLRPLFAHPEATHREAVHAMIESGEMVRTERWKLAIYSGDEVGGELYDLRADPREHRNLFFDPAHTAVRERLLGRIARHMLSFRPAPSRAERNASNGSPDPVLPRHYP
jgi:arylsulfatase A-like enzyme